MRVKRTEAQRILLAGGGGGEIMDIQKDHDIFIFQRLHFQVTLRGNILINCAHVKSSGRIHNFMCLGGYSICADLIIYFSSQREINTTLYSK